MRQSQLFTKTRKETPSDEVAKNAQLLIRAGFIHKEMSGVYSFLPLGLRVMNRIIGIIREEMNVLGAQELHLTALQDPRVWQESGRWSDEAVDNWFKTAIKTGGDAGLAFTHEEPIARIMTDHVRSYKDLPFSAYQFQTKFRNETRAKSGMLRGREFLMKDLYSFSRNEKEHEAFYQKVIAAYKKIFERVGIGEKTLLTFASGGSFSKYSHEFQTLTSAGEDVIHLCENCRIAVNGEIIREVESCPKCKGALRKGEKSVEVGNIFPLGTKYAQALGLSYLDEKGKKQYVYMGSYGIGPGRVMGTIVELGADEKGIVWPKSVAPFLVHLIVLGEDTKVFSAAEALYTKLGGAGIETLFDDRDLSAGEKFADADLIGIPMRVVVSEKTLAKGTVEVKDRASGKVKMLSEYELLGELR